MQDAIIRRRRMMGDAALWVPGSDHAGIATQAVVERQLAAEGISRHDLGRERFVDEVWKWKAKSGDRIATQIRTLGFSTDWTRERFTLDDGLSRAVREVFVRLYEEGLIYRGERIINWSPGSHSAISDIEVEYHDEVGELVHIEYPFVAGPLADGTTGITVATTRAETMLGDTGVAVHPDDPRYRDAVGKTVRLPLLDREIPVVADDGVDMEFGTGAVKVTPAHDPLDFEIAARHGLPPIVILDGAARITEAGGPFAGLDRFEAREAVKAALDEQGYLRGIVEHHHSVGYDSRTHVPVEPLLSTQWFVKVGPLVGPAVDAVRNGEITFHPKRWENSYFHWMENLRDWCISRQLWWGHRIPAWYCDDCGELLVAVETPERCLACGHTGLRPDDDVLDTWFSSALWPFSTLGWPEQTDDLARFYPNDVLVTGFDIIYFWVARMIKMGLHFAGDKPFSDVVIHGLVRAPDGRKMSKSLNNAIDPLEMSAEYGADALRLALLQAAAPGQDIPLQTEWVDAARRFGNKLWNAVRFARQHLEPGDVPAEGGYPEDPGAEARWILSRLSETAAKVDDLLDKYRFSDGLGALYTFAWSEVFDWFIELAKAPLQSGDGADDVRATLGVVVRDLLKFLHPTMPFVTEELWSHLVGDGLVAASGWPRPPAYAAPAGMATAQELIGGVRRFRAEHGLSPRAELRLLVADPDGIAENWWTAQFASLAAAELDFSGPPDSAAGHTRLVADTVEAYIPLADVIDLAAERERLTKELGAAEAALAKTAAKLANEQFRERAPAEVVAKEEAKAAELEDRIGKLTSQLAELG
jgi:valyl-tRNA synthetase